jgi:hypothetical protein
MAPADRITSPRKHALHHRVSDDLQIRAALDRVQVADCSAAAQPFAAGLLEVSGALLDGAVEIVVARNADLFGCIDEFVAQFAVESYARYRNRPARAVKIVTAPFLVFRPAEIGQHIVI